MHGEPGAVGVLHAVGEAVPAGRAVCSIQAVLGRLDGERRTVIDHVGDRIGFSAASEARAWPEFLLLAGHRQPPVAALMAFNCSSPFGRAVVADGVLRPGCGRQRASARAAAPNRVLNDEVMMAISKRSGRLRRGGKDSVGNEGKVAGRRCPTVPPAISRCGSRNATAASRCPAPTDTRRRARQWRCWVVRGWKGWRHQAASSHAIEAAHRAGRRHVQAQPGQVGDHRGRQQVVGAEQRCSPGCRSTCGQGTHVAGRVGGHFHMPDRRQLQVGIGIARACRRLTARPEACKGQVRH